MLAAGAVHGFGGRLLGQLLLANRARFCHHVDHNSHLLRTWLSLLREASFVPEFANIKASANPRIFWMIMVPTVTPALKIPDFR